MKITITVDQVSEGDTGALAGDGALDTDALEDWVADHLDEQGHDHGPVIVEVTR